LIFNKNSNLPNQISRILIDVGDDGDLDRRRRAESPAPPWSARSVNCDGAAARL
jgi:hypothetical protein